MSGSVEPSVKPGFLRRHRAALLALAVLALIAGFLVWTWRYLRPGSWRFYTDEIGLRRLAADVEPRPVLWGRAAPLTPDFDTPSDIGRAVLSPDGTKLAYARGGTNGNSDLFLAQRLGAGWSAPRAMPALNSVFGETAPVFSGDGRYLFFASDRPGGFGGLDIWVARWDGTTFAWPLPLDAGVNSPHNETSPSPSSDGTLLYFASDRPREAGGMRTGMPTIGRPDYDLFYAERIPPGVTNTEIERAQNILYSLRERALSDTNVMAKLGGTPASEAAVDRGLAWLAKTQETNGSWSIARSGGQDGHDVAATALALLAFYGRSERHDRPGPYRDTVRRGLDWLVAQVNPLTGDVRGGSSGGKNMYDQCIGTLAIAEAYGLTHDPALFDPLQSAVFFVADAQHAQGGWRYVPNTDRDLSVSGWAIMALKSAELSGLHVQRRAVEGMRAMLRDCSGGEHGGQFVYQPAGGRETKAMQATGFFCSQLMGLSPNSRKAFEAARRVGTEGAMDDVYFLYYGTLAGYQFQGPLWRAWRDRMHADMLAAQNADGSWMLSGGSHAQAAGRAVATALVTLSLQAHYRYTPLYGLGYEPPAEAGPTAGADYDQLPDMPNFEPAHRFYDVINTAADETDPWLTARGDFLYFASNRRGGEGGFDLYRVRVSSRMAQGVESLGPDVNTPADEMGPATRDAGFGLVFVSGAEGEGSARLMAAPSRRVWRERDYATMPEPGWVIARYPIRLTLAAAALLGFVVTGALVWRWKRS